jgi:hypothetical protein
VRGELADGVLEPPVGPIFPGRLTTVNVGPTGSYETSSANSPHTSWDYPKAKKQIVSILYHDSFCITQSGLTDFELIVDRRRIKLNVAHF